MQDAADAGRHHHCSDVVQLIDLDDVRHQIHPLLPDVVQPAHKGADHRGAGLRPQQGLIDRETEGLVDFDVVPGQDGNGLEPLGRAGNFDPGIGNPLGDVPALGNHPGGVQADHFHGDGAGDDVGDFLDGGAVAFGPADALFSRQGRVGRDAADNAQFGALADFLNVGGIQKQFHSFTCYCRPAAGGVGVAFLGCGPALAGPG